MNRAGFVFSHDEYTDGKKDNGLIVNTVTQVTNTPNRIAVTINKENYSHHIIKQTGKMNINCLTIDAPFKVFESFGFVSGRTVDKFADCTPNRSENGLVVLPRYINSFISLEVEKYVDMDTHGIFICKVTEARVLSGYVIETKSDMVKAAKNIGNTYGCAVLLKGGHSISDADDLLYANGDAVWFEGVRINNPNTHGTGCTLSSAIAANLAKGYDLAASVHRAKEYISGALSDMLDLGEGSGPMNHAFDLTGQFSK